MTNYLAPNDNRAPLKKVQPPHFIDEDKLRFQGTKRLAKDHPVAQQGLDPRAPVYTPLSNLDLVSL